MELKGDKRLVGLMLSGQQIQLPGANLFITQPTINQIVTFGEDDFLIAISLLGNTKKLIDKVKQGNSELQMYPDFQLLMIVLQEDLSVRMLIENLFTLIFPDYLIQIEQVAINFLVQDEENEEAQPFLVGQIHPYNFEVFQNILYDLFSPKGSKEEPDFQPANEAAAAIAAKLQKGREKRAEQRGPQSLFGIYCSILSIGLNIDINILYNYTPFQLYDAYSRYTSKMESDFYMRVSTMPFMDTSKMERPEEWTRNLY